MSRNTVRLVLPLARHPGFCCGCICLGQPDARRMRRVLRIVRSAVRRRMI